MSFSQIIIGVDVSMSVLHKRMYVRPKGKYVED